MKELVPGSKPIEVAVTTTSPGLNVERMAIRIKPP